MKKIIILMGVPGSGKGTQATMLASRTGYAHISTGELLRALETDPDGDPDDKVKLAAMKSGALVSDGLIFKLAFAEIEQQIALGHGVVLDGAIRSVEQAKAFEQFFESHGWKDDVIAIEIAITDAETLRRVEMRIASGRGRADDAPEVVAERVKAQGNEAIQPILAYYRELGILVTIDGLLPIPRVAEEIEHILAD
jgi:adenylate kinase